MSILFDESPELGYASIIITGVGIVLKDQELGRALTIIGIMMFVALLYFYRWSPCTVRVPDGYVISPCQGQIVAVEQRGNYHYIAIFLSIFDRHTQVYPVNGRVIRRYYDKTGKFKLVRNVEKSKENEKVIHWIQTSDGIVSVTQIAGALPRVIVFEKDIGIDVKAGEDLGMIKFGSRIDLEVPNMHCMVSVGDKVNIGQILCIRNNLL